MLIYLAGDSIDSMFMFRVKNKSIPTVNKGIFVQNLNILLSYNLRKFIFLGRCTQRVGQHCLNGIYNSLVRN